MRFYARYIFGIFAIRYVNFKDATDPRLIYLVLDSDLGISGIRFGPYPDPVRYPSKFKHISNSIIYGYCL